MFGVPSHVIYSFASSHTPLLWHSIPSCTSPEVMDPRDHRLKETVTPSKRPLPQVGMLAILLLYRENQQRGLYHCWSAVEHVMGWRKFICQIPDPQKLSRWPVKEQWQGSLYTLGSDAAVMNVMMWYMKGRSHFQAFWSTVGWRCWVGTEDTKLVGWLKAACILMQIWGPQDQSPQRQRESTPKTLTNPVLS